MRPTGKSLKKRDTFQGEVFLRVHLHLSVPLCFPLIDCTVAPLSGENLTSSTCQTKRNRFGFSLKAVFGFLIAQVVYFPQIIMFTSQQKYVHIIGGLLHILSGNSDNIFLQDDTCFSRVRQNTSWFERFGAPLGSFTCKYFFG